jgi:hypothetical protein
MSPTAELLQTMLVAESYSEFCRLGERASWLKVDLSDTRALFSGFFGGMIDHNRVEGVFSELRLYMGFSEVS